MLHPYWYNHPWPLAGKSSLLKRNHIIKLEVQYNTSSGTLFTTTRSPQVCRFVSDTSFIQSCLMFLFVP